METAKEYIIKKHKLSVVMHEVAPNNFHPFLHLDTACRLMEEYAALVLANNKKFGEIKEEPIYVIFDPLDNVAICAFTNRERSEKECDEGDLGLLKITLNH